MRIRVLGSAAGGGYPQWNCDCPCCQAVRDGSRPARARTQSSVAVSADGDRWVLVNASPDIHRQIEAFPALRPRAREVPITSVLLTDGELDHTLGLALLREARGVRVAGTPATKDFLRNGSTLLSTLEAYCPVEWTDVIPGSGVPLGEGPGGDRLIARAFDAPTRKKPRFPGVGEGKGRVVGYRITDSESGSSAAVLPGVQDLTPDVLDELRGCDAVLIDGTCWTDDEMITLGLAGKTSRDMGHVPVSGPGGSLEALAALDAGRKVYTHLNNSNPLLLEDSPQRKEAESHGMEIAYDGLEIAIP
ncbi:MAG: pyrroloquinoline quinone biosynthesis protein PqqB [Streptosporangiales bacterium]|nr:pyrroloquinoline quinone biosynthesis protein PqqB [Streptosporangiales bacterium]